MLTACGIQRLEKMSKRIAFQDRAATIQIYNLSDPGASKGKDLKSENKNRWLLKMIGSFV